MSFIKRSLTKWKDWWIGLAIGLIVLMLTACASPMPPSPVRPPLPPLLLQPCPPLSPLQGTTGADVLRKLVEVGEAYHDCAVSKDALIKAAQ